MAKVLPIERGRNQVLYRYGPERVFYHEKSGLVERVLALKQDEMRPQLTVNRQQLHDRLRQEISHYADADLRPEEVARVQVNVIRPDYVVSRAFPYAFYCEDCGRLYIPDADWRTPNERFMADLRAAVPASFRCLERREQGPCNGRLRQYYILTTHNCGREVFVPIDTARCRTHGVSRLFWYRQGSERGANWRIECGIDGCGFALEARRSFYAQHYNCPLDGTGALPSNGGLDFDSAPYMKATHYIPRVVNLLNSDNTLNEIMAGTPSAVVAALGCLRDEGAFRGYDANGGFQDWNRTYSEGSAAGAGPEALTKLTELRAARQYLARVLPNNDQTRIVLAKYDADIAAFETQSAVRRTPTAELMALVDKPDYVRQIRDTTLYMDGSKGFDLADLGEQNVADPTYAENLSRARAAFPRLHIKDLRYQERVPLTAALIGFSRGSYRPNETRLNFYQGGGPDEVNVFANQTQTEAIWVQLDPTATLRWLIQRTGEAQPVADNFTDDLLTLQKRFTPAAIGQFGQITDEWTKLHYAVLHTFSHLFVKATARNSGLEQEGIGEELLPFTNSFLAYANHSSEFVLGGLQLVVEHHMANLLDGLFDYGQRCVYNPVCDKVDGACHGCIHLGEVSCTNFNRVLNRNHLVGPQGFWR